MLNNKIINKYDINANEENLKNEMIIRYRHYSDRIKIVGSKFVKNNKYNGRLIINNKKKELKEYLNLRNNEKFLVVKLKGINYIEDMSYMLSECEELESLLDISKWNTNHVINMSYMSCKCESLESLADISKWKANHVRYKNYMFSECDSLGSLPYF